MGLFTAAAVILIGAIVFLWVFFGFYVTVMGLYRLKLAGTLGRTLRVLGMPYLVLGLLLDVLANITVFWLLFLEMPHEWLVTKRLQRHMRQPGTWRYKRAKWLCHRVLDPLDPTGRHC